MNLFAEELNYNRTRLKITGTVLAIIGAMLLFYLYLFPVNAILYIAINIFVASLVLLIQTLRFWYRSWLGLLLHFSISIIYLVTSVIIFWKFDFRLMLVLLLCLFYFLIGCYRIYVAFSQWYNSLGWGFTAFCGIVNIFLTMLALLYFYNLSFPMVVLGIACDIFLTGIAFIALGFGANKIANSR